MKAALKNIIAANEHAAETIHLDSEIVKMLEGTDITLREFDEFVHDLGKTRMMARRILEAVK
tara:strand:+ start:1250 stop:1435 length:186 start_codon:yes stop_codon:yes gene_type:complete